MKKFMKGLVSRKVSIVVIGILILLICQHYVESAVGVALFCNSAFPGDCNQGGCDAEPGWYAISCILHCADTREVVCQKIMK